MTASQTFAGSTPQFVQVAVPVHLRKLFTYRLPESMRASARVGARVMVQLGTKSVSGYIVALMAQLRRGTSLVESEIKEVQELLDLDPPLTNEVLELTRWVAEYYAAPWGEVIRAALPAGINATVEQTLSITRSGRREILNSPGDDDVKMRSLNLLAEEGEFEINALSLRMGSSRIPKWLRELETDGLVERGYRTRNSAARTKRRRAVRLNDPLKVSVHPDPDINAADKSAPRKQRMTPAQQRALEVLREHPGGLPLADLLRQAAISDSAVKTLIKRGLVAEYEQEIRRDPLSRAALPAIEALQLTAAQLAALRAMEASLKDKAFASILLHGVTGSGKTEIYIRAMERALEMNRGAMMLVPEISLTPILARRLRSRFGEQIAIFHSSLSKGERFDEWSRLRAGKARVVLGTRSAVFAPVKNLGLIIIDEEQDSSYRQEESPFYHARDTAIVRAQKESAVVVLGSATPSLETFHHAQTGKYKYLHLADRVANRPLARAELIDMRAVFARHKRSVVFSDDLIEAISQTHARGEQTIILRNRRGYASFVPCRSCGATIDCPSCDVTLTYHRSNQTLVCHYCNHHQRAPQNCPKCGSKYLFFIGEGTEQIEELVRKQFPQLRIARIDRDTKGRRHEFEKTLLDFSNGEIDLLVGTQMLAKGHDFPNVTLAGVLSVDSSVTLPDFRAAERTFQLITQVAGRAGRGDRPGRVLIQTYHPDHYAVRLATAQDYERFYEQEIQHRRNYNFPPFTALALFLVRHKDAARAGATAQQLRTALNKANAEHSCRILGPASAPFARLRDEYRLQIWIKSGSRKQMRAVIDQAVKDFEEGGGDSRSATLEIDPVNMM